MVQGPTQAEPETSRVPLPSRLNRHFLFLTHDFAIILFSDLGLMYLTLVSNSVNSQRMILNF